MSDLLLLIGATAIGFSGGRVLVLQSDIDWGWEWHEAIHPDPDLAPISDPWDAPAHLLYKATGLTVPILLAYTLTALLARLRSPRPSRRRLWRQPGFLASVAVLLSFTWQAAAYLAFHGVENLLREHRRGTTIPNLAVWLVHDFHTYAIERLDAGWVVAIAWLFLGTSGRLQAQPGWVDRLGRAVGIAWILVTVIVRACWFFLMSHV